MSIKSLLTKRNLTIISLVVLSAVIVANQYLSSLKSKTTQPRTEPLLTESSTTPKSVYDSSDYSETEFEAFLKEYQFMFYHLPSTENATSVGWNNDIPLVVQGTSILNVLSTKSEKEFLSETIIILNNEGRALAINANSSTIFDDSKKLESTINNKEKEEFTYIWYKKPKIYISLSSDAKSIFLRDSDSDQTSPIYTTDSEINPLSISTNNNQISFTDKNYLYIAAPNTEIKKILLSKSTIQSITFWLKNDLFLVEKVEVPRLLDFIMYVDQKDLSFKQIITSSSITNRLNLNIHLSINKKQDMVIFVENNGLAWILSKDQAITRIFPKLKLPVGTWTHPGN